MPSAGPLLARPGALEANAEAAGLVPGEAFDAFALEYPDEPTSSPDALAGPVAELAEAIGEEVDGVDPPLPGALCRGPDGGYRVATEWRTLIARAGAGVTPRARNMNRLSAKK